MPGGDDDQAGISGAARLAGVVGWPVAHSLSPRLHGYWLRRHRIDGAYLPLPVRPEDLAQALAALPKLGFRGVNLTVPHKEAALSLVDAASDAARAIGAVNTLVVTESGGLAGDNTDAEGFVANLRAAVPGWSAAAGPAVVLGAGGAACAVVFALTSRGAPEVRLVNRTFDRAAALAARMPGPVLPLPWAERAEALDGAALLVNTTTLGMTGQPPLDLDLAALPAAAVVCDLVYVPLETDLLARARARGNSGVDGLGMLLHQARPGFERWFGVAPEVTPELRAHVLAAVRR